jgi:hypothetical protein
MKNYKVKFSLVNLFFQTQKEVQRLQTMWGAIAVVICTSTFINASDRYALYAALGCAVIDKLIGCLWLEERI